MRYDDYIERHAPGLPVVFLRLYVGLYFLYCAVTFFSRGTVGTAAFNQRLGQLLAFGQLPVLGAYFKALAGIPTDLLASAMLAVFLMVGMSFILGLHVRLFGALAWVFLLHRYLLGYLGPADGVAALADQHTLTLGLIDVLAVAILVVVWTSAGRRWGVDSLVWRRRLRREFAYPENPEFDPLTSADSPEKSGASTGEPTEST